jgi:hypothetical protein
VAREGKLSQEAALVYAEKCGIVVSNEISMDHRLSLSMTKEVFNFCVYKWNKVRTVQRLILQFDFKSQTLSDIQQGRRAEKIEFQDIVSYQSEDGLRLLIHFANHGEYELDANTLDEKNKMIRLLSSILHHYELDHSDERCTEPNEEQDSTNLELKSVLSPSPFAMPPPDPLHPSTVIPRTLKEGIIEKKGHSAAFLMWPERYLKVCEGELLYYKAEEREQALNIIPLKANITRVEKTGTRGFVVSLVHSKKSFSFRTRMSDSGKSAEVERNEWCKAILGGCRSRRKSDARLRRGTVTAKQYMEEVKIEKKLKKQTENLHAADKEEYPSEGGHYYSTDEMSIIQPTKDMLRRRSQTLTSANEPLGSTKSVRRGKSVTHDTMKRGSTFYTTSMDVTTPFVVPVMEMDPLVVTDRSPSQLLHSITKELESLAEVVLPTTTGKSRVDMIVTRMGNIVAALKQWVRNNEELCEQEGGRASDSIQEPLSPSSIGSHESLPSVRVVDGSSDNCSIHSNDINSDEQERKKVISSAAPRTHLPLFGENIISVQEEDKDGRFCDKGITTNPKSSFGDEETAPSSPVSQTVLDSLSLPSSKSEQPILPPQPCCIPSTPLSPGIPRPPVHSEIPQPLLSPGVSLPPVPPPPPLPSLSEVPPPPLPPGVPPPPPVPGMNFPIWSERRPTRKMKRFHWNLIAPTAVQSSVWMDVATKEVAEDIDYAELEKVFSAETQEIKRPNIGTKLYPYNVHSNFMVFLPCISGARCT